MDFETMYDLMVEYELATEDEIGVACHFDGRTVEALNELLFYKTGYRDIRDIFAELDEDMDELETILTAQGA